LERRIRDLRAGLVPLRSAMPYDLTVQTWAIGTDTVATRHGPLVRLHLGVDLREGDLHARTGVVTSCESRMGVTALYRVPGDRRAIAIPRTQASRTARVWTSGNPSSSCRPTLQSGTG